MELVKTIFVLKHRRSNYWCQELWLYEAVTAWKVSRHGVLSGPYSVRMRENTDQKKLRIWTLFTQCVAKHYFAKRSTLDVCQSSEYVFEKTDLLIESFCLKLPIVSSWWTANACLINLIIWLHLIFTLRGLLKQEF